MKLNEIKFADDKKNRFYKAIWGNNYLDFPVKQNSTYCEFQVQNDSIEETFINVFEINNQKEFKIKYEQAISGDGKEDNKITNMRSSSLCSLLFFYNVTPRNTLTLQLDGEKCIFEYSIFEFKNKVISRPSNMDIVLFGKKENGDKCILFLESKFGEYYFDVTRENGVFDVPYSYYKRYGKLYTKIVEKLDFKSDFSEKEKNDGKFFEILPSTNEHYIAGIKQMVSHYIGIQKFANGNYVNTENSRTKTISDFLRVPYLENQLLDKLKENAEIYLAEIVFDKGIKDLKISEKVDYYSDYKELHSKLAKILKEDNKKPEIHIVKDLLKYSDCNKWNHEIEKGILDYYFGENDG